MIFISELHKKTLLLVDKLVEENKTFNEVYDILTNKGYRFRTESHNGYIIKTRFQLCDKDGKYSFVDLKKRRNGLATWESYKIS